MAGKDASGQHAEAEGSLALLTGGFFLGANMYGDVA